MFKSLMIKNFKSIANAEIELRRVNIFIGPPNSGKSNLIDALYLISCELENPQKYLRFLQISDIFYEQDISREIEISVDDYEYIIKYKNGKLEIERNIVKNVSNDSKAGPITIDIKTTSYRSNLLGIPNLRIYRFWDHEYSNLEGPPLKYPSGENLLGTLLSIKKLRILIGNLLKSFDLRLVLVESERRIQVQWEKEEGIAVALDFRILSEGLKNIILHLVAIESNNNAILCFEEPESKTFPYYSKYLAEKIASDTRNQYIITTHNPYFLISLIEKTPSADLSLYITYMRKHQTLFKLLEKEEISELLDYGIDLFFNIDKFIG